MAFGFQLPTYGQKKDEEEKKLPMQSKVPMQSKIPSKETTPTPSVMTSNKADIIPRQPMMSYNVEGTIMPGVTDKTATNLQKYAKENSKSITEEKILLDEMYQEAVKVQQRKLYEKDRSEMKADMGYKAYNATDPEEKKRLTTAVQLANLSDILREGAKKEGFDAYNMNDKDLIVAYGEANPDKQQMIVDYLNKDIDSMEVARQIGAIEEEAPVVEEDKGFLGRLWDGVKGTAEGISKAGEGGVNLLDKLLGIEELANATQYSYDTYGMSPMDLAKQDPDKYNQYKYEIEQGVADKYKTSISEDVLDLGQGTLAAASTAAVPGIIAGITVAGATKSGGAALEIVTKTFGTIGKVINMIPGLSDFRNSLPEEKKAEFDMFVGGTVGALLLGTKGKANIIKNPKQFVIDNIGSKQIINNFKENVIGITKPVVGATKNINKAPEIVARKLTKTSSAQDKLFKAQNPTLNVLNKNRNFKTIRAESDLANELIVKKGHKPIDTETRRIAHEDTMKSKWLEIESKIKDKGKYKVDQLPFAKIIDDFVKDVKKSGIVKNTADIKALEAESKLMKSKSQRFLDLPSLEKKKQFINGIVNNWGDSAIGDVYKNGMKKVTRAIGEIEDSTLAKIPGEFSNLKKEFGALKATYEDILKADLKAQKAKGMDIMESYSRFEGISDIIGGTLSIFTKGSAGLADVVKGVGKLFMGKVLKKMKDSDFLIEEGFEDLSSKISTNATKNPIMNNNIKPVTGMRKATPKVKAPLQEKIDRPVVRMKAPEDLYHTSTQEIGKLTDDKVLRTTPDSKYTLKYGKEGSRNTYKVSSEGLNILDGTSKKGIDVIEGINKKLGDKGFSAGVLSDDGKVISFVLKDKNFVAELKKMGYDGLRTTESSMKGGAESIGIINPSKVKNIESKGLKPKK